MVRHKRRWLLVRVERIEDLRYDTTGTGESSANDDYTGWSRERWFPSWKELSQQLRDTHLECFGEATSGIMNDVQVRFCDPITRMALIRVPRVLYGQARATISLITEVKKHRAVLRVFSVHGSTRTAKIKAMKEIRRVFQPKINQAPTKNAQVDLCLQMAELLTSLQNME